MARTQAADYPLRRKAILDQAAKLYAAKGFLGASIADLAKACNMSKSLIYHYYRSKEDILFDLAHSHIKSVVDAVRLVSESEMMPEDRIRALTKELMCLLYSDAADRHRVILRELNFLSARRRKVILGLEREMVTLAEDMLSQARSTNALPARARGPTAMLFFGMLNWSYTWLDPKGPLSLRDVAHLASELILHGVRGARLPASAHDARKGRASSGQPLEHGAEIDILAEKP
jgi:AcrR family transcriptional regulator